MECNKDEATRAREIANSKFLANDVSGARKFALKAQFLYPELEGISQMVATFDVHLSAQNVIHGQIDYYGVLGLNPEADDQTVRRRYRELAVMLHPDRNKSVGAEEAFKLLSQAWGVFSDKAKRADYDLKRNKGLHEAVGASASKPTDNGTQKVCKTSSNIPKVKSTKRGVKRANDGSAAATTSVSGHKIPDGTFWTVCRTCRTQYEYHRVYLNQNLLCPNCRKPFIAVETDPPGSGSIRKTFYEHQFSSIRHTADGRKKSVSGRDNNGVHNEYDSFDWAVPTGTKNHSAQTGSRKDEVVRREYTKRVPGVPSTNAPKRRKGAENTAGGGNIASYFASKSYSVRQFSEDELKKLLKKKAKLVISRKLQELCTAITNNETAAGMETEDHSKANAGSSENKRDTESCFEDSVQNTCGIDKYLNFMGGLTIDVPDADFCDFNKHRTEKSFRDNQVWACYDSFDGMPRSYVIVDKVISVDPLKMRISWLASVTNSELSSTKWLGFGIAKTCGEFRVGNTQICRSPYSLSHKIELTKDNEGEFLIYPRKGDVWALYRNWSHEWNYLTGVGTVAYDIVEVLEGYTEECGVSVVPLVKVAGFRSVFHHHLDPNETRRILRDEISRFSHKIPAYLLTGGEAPGAPRGCRQLDPAATPAEFLQVIDDHRISIEDLKDILEYLGEQDVCLANQVLWAVRARL